jgi:hypothetical protein
MPGGELPVVYWDASAIVSVHAAPLRPPGYAPTNRSTAFEGVDVMEFRGDKVCRITTLFDPRVPAEQLLGLRLFLPPGSFRERVVVWGQQILAFRARHSRQARAT